MSNICAEHHHSYPLFSTKKTVRDIDLPPRKLLNRRSNLPISISDHFLDEKPTSETTLLHKFLPYCNGEDEESDEFRMYEFKVRRCMRSRSHDWTDCPFAHPGEKARRRDPRRFHYSGNACTDFRRGCCPRGDSCEFAHGVFECWLHPARYRTQACKDGQNCKRKVCFFAHTAQQLRLLPFCHSVASSPTSTLMGLSHLSPPLSPTFSPPTNQSLTGVLSYKNALRKLVSSLEAMDLSEASPTGSVNGNLSWGSGVSTNCADQQQFILSPCTPLDSGSRDFFNEDVLSNNGGSCPDLEWVNELVM